MGIATSPTIEMFGGIMTSPTLIGGVITSPSRGAYRFYGVRVPQPPIRLTARKVTSFVRGIRPLLEALEHDPRTGSAFVNAVLAERGSDAKRLARKLGLRATFEPADALLVLAAIGPEMRPAKIR